MSVHQVGLEEAPQNNHNPDVYRKYKSAEEREFSVGKIVHLFLAMY